MAGPQHHALDATTNTTSCSRRPQAELDPVKRAALFIKMNDLVVKAHVVIPVVYRPRVRGDQPSCMTPLSGLGQRPVGRCSDWYREA